MNDTINQVGAGAPALPAERAAFEALFKMPSHCIRVGDGYVATEYNAWGAHEYSHLRRGWLAALKWQASTLKSEPAAHVTKGDCAFWVQWTEVGKPLRGIKIPLYLVPPAHPDAALVEALRKAKPEWAKKCPVFVTAFIREHAIFDADMIEEMLQFAADIAALAGKGGE